LGSRVTPTGRSSSCRICPDRRLVVPLRGAGSAPASCPITVLAAQIGWERSRVSHHVRRMSARGLVTCGLSAADRRVTEVALTGRGRQAQEDAAPGHVDLVRRLFFGGLPEGLVGPLSEALESVYANIIEQGSLPPPVDWHPAEG
jgi:DNA-binding MarR family transcriptional regulator